MTDTHSYELFRIINTLYKQHTTWSSKVAHQQMRSLCNKTKTLDKYDTYNSWPNIFIYF